MPNDELQAEPLEVPSCQIGASPSWDAERGELLWVDVMARYVHRLDVGSGRTETFRTPSDVGCVVPRAGGGYVLGLEDGFWVCDDRFEAFEPRGRFHDRADGIRMNAGKADRAGRFWAGTMAYDLRPGAGALARLDTDGSIEVLVEGLGEANGFGWSPDDRTFYLVDSGIGVIDAFDHDAASGTIADRRTIVRVPREEGLTDGMTVDTEGSIWLSLWGGWSVRRYGADGDLQATVGLPVGEVTGCTFGGPDLGDLYITTASFMLSLADSAAQPLAGRLFRARPGQTGLRAPRFGEALP